MSGKTNKECSKVRKKSRGFCRARSAETTGKEKPVAVSAPAVSSVSLRQAFTDIDKIRKRAKPLTGLTMKDLIQEGRR